MGLALAALAVSCQLVAGLDKPLPNPAADASPGVDGGPEDDSSAGGDAEGGGCPAATGGPQMVNVGPFCIDSTEVTNAQYDVFVQADASLALQPAECAFNTGYTPQQPWPYSAGLDRYPVTQVNWCMAYAFCKWAGKRLCGAIGGGSAPFSNYTAFSNQHYYACSANGQNEFPYGATYVPGNCDDSQYGGTGGDAGPLPAGSLASCQGGTNGLFDMVGSVEEWQDACQSATGPDDQCLDGTGSFSYPPSDGGPGPGCDFEDNDNRNATYDNLGFRCCAP
jgi:formylglycine-generating enzyme required for sulfatase activity